jgi:hypothetical protein
MKKILYITAVLTVIAFSGMQAQKPVTREVSNETNVAKGSLVRIVGANRKLNIKSWDQSKVKIVAQVVHDSSVRKMTNDEWLEQLGISVKPFSNRVDILAHRTGSHLNPITVVGRPTKKKTVGTTHSADEMVYVEALTAAAAREHGLTSTYRHKDDVTLLATTNIISLDITIPAGSKLDVDNQYGDVFINMNVDEAKLDISNGALDMQDVKNLELTGKYCNANFGNVDKAEIEFQNGTLHAQSINDLDLDSKSSTIDYEKGRDLFIRSQVDNITIGEITKVDGRKTYGSIRIDMLNGNFDLEGINVDIKIKNINPQVEMIKINNKYGDVRLPVRNLKNYFVDFTGYYSAVFTPFQKTIIKDKEEEKKTGDENPTTQQLTEMALAGEYHRTSATVAGEIAPKRFTGTVGDVNGKHTRFQLTCHSCTVDFK